MGGELPDLKRQPGRFWGGLPRNASTQPARSLLGSEQPWRPSNSPVVRNPAAGLQTVAGSAIKRALSRMSKPPRTKTPSAAFWGVYKVTPEGLDLVGGIGRNREDAINAACRALGYPPTARTPSTRLVEHWVIRQPPDATSAACRALGYPPFSENRLTAAGWTIGKLRAFVEED
jgi:hypothetical protein